MNKWELKLKSGGEPFIVEADQMLGTPQYMEFRLTPKGKPWQIIAVYTQIEWWRVIEDKQEAA